MTDDHVPTPQEDQIYDALTAGDQDALKAIEDAVYGTEEELPVEGPGGPQTPGLPDIEQPPVELTPEEQYEADYANAHARYQADNEAPESEREANTKAKVVDENQAAKEKAKA